MGFSNDFLIPGVLFAVAEPSFQAKSCEVVLLWLWLTWEAGLAGKSPALHGAGPTPARSWGASGLLESPSPRESCDSMTWQQGVSSAGAPEPLVTSPPSPCQVRALAAPSSAQNWHLPHIEQLSFPGRAALPCSGVSSDLLLRLPELPLPVLSVSTLADPAASSGLCSGSAPSKPPWAHTLPLGTPSP